MQPFESERLAYRPMRMADARDAFAIFGDPEAMRWSPFGVHPDIDRTAALLQRIVAHQERHGFGFWAVTEGTHGPFVGMCGLAVDAELGGLELAYRFRRNRWGRGYASEATRAWVMRGFRELGFPRICAVVEPDHGASIRVLEKLGMTVRARRTLHGKPVLIMAVARPEPAGTEGEEGA